jgi:hypothetical protein
MCQHEHDYRDYRTRGLSASTRGRGIKVTATATPGTLVHQALDSAAANEWDVLRVQAINTSASAVTLTLEWGGTTSPDDLITITLPPNSGLVEVVPGLGLQGSVQVRAFATTANVVMLHGVVQRYEASRS